MKLNIFQKITFFVYLLVLIFICTFFVPYYNYHDVIHSYIFSKNNIILNRFTFYLTIPTLLFVIIYIYLGKTINQEKPNYKEKAKQEIYIFLFFIAVAISIFIFLVGMNKYALSRKEGIKNEIVKIENNYKISYFLDNRNTKLLDCKIKELIKNGGTNEAIDNFLDDFIFNLNTKKIYEMVSKSYEIGTYEIFKIKLQNYKIRKIFYDRVTSNYNLGTFEEFEAGIHKETVPWEKYYGKAFIPPTDAIVVQKKLPLPEEILGIQEKKQVVTKKNLLQNKQNELNKITFYDIRYDFSIMLIIAFMLIYIIRPLFIMFRGMLREVS